MPREQARTRAATVSAIEEWLARPALLRVVVRLLVHTARSERGAYCPCCGSRFAYVSREVSIDELLIDTVGHRRVLRSEALARGGDAEWTHSIAEAKTVAMDLRCSDWRDQESGWSEEDVLMDRETKVWVAGGANRSGKSQLGATWLALRWLWRGGDRRLFRVMGPELGQAHILKRKLFEGEGMTPPVFPAELVAYIPSHTRVANQTATLVDGTEFQLTHAKSAKHLKGVRVEDTLWTEVTECPHEEAYSVSVARTTDTGGQLYLDSTPKRGHWLLDVVMEARKEKEDRKAGKSDERPGFREIAKPMSGNPWLDQVEVVRSRAAAHAIDPIMARREFDGEWVGGHALIFGEVWDGSVHTVDLWDPKIEELGIVDVTRKVSRTVWRGDGVDWVIGVDVNRNPHTAVVCKIWCHPSHEDAIGLLVFDELRTWNSDAYGAAFALGQYKDGAYKGGGILIDANAAHKNQHVAHTGGRSTTPVKDYERFGFRVRTPRHPQSGKPYNPPVRDSTALVSYLMRQRVGPQPHQIPRLIVNAAHCPGVIRAIESQEDRGDGQPVKVAGGASDREIAAYTDSLRYLTWPVFSRGVYQTKAYTTHIK